MERHPLDPALLCASASPDLPHPPPSTSLCLFPSAQPPAQNPPDSGDISHPSSHSFLPQHLFRLGWQHPIFHPSSSLSPFPLSQPHLWSPALPHAASLRTFSVPHTIYVFLPHPWSLCLPSLNLFYLSTQSPCVVLVSISSLPVYPL